MADLGAEDGDGDVATRSDIFRFAASSEWEMLLLYNCIDCLPNPSYRDELRVGTSACSI